MFHGKKQTKKQTNRQRKQQIFLLRFKLASGGLKWPETRDARVMVQKKDHPVMDEIFNKTRAQTLEKTSCSVTCYKYNTLERFL